MNNNYILDEIRSTRDAQAKECEYDARRLFQILREETDLLKKQGWTVIPHHKKNTATERVFETPPSDS
jgi:hypothetical protein